MKRLLDRFALWVAATESAGGNINNRPPYLRYLLCWCLVWMLITNAAELPQWFQSSQILAPYQHESFGSEFFGYLWTWSLAEAVFGLVWGSISWLLQWGALRWSISPMRAAGQVAALEAVVLGVPLSLLYMATVNLTFFDDGPNVIISNGAIAVNVVGILLAFPLACLFAAYRGAPRKSASASVMETEAATQENHLTVWPPSPKTNPHDEV